MQTMRPLVGIAALLALLATALAGCGGGGGGGGAADPPVDVVNGTVSNGGGSTSGDVVEFDDMSTVKATVNGSNSYTLVVPASDVTGSDSLWILDGSGNVLDIVSITLSNTGGQTVTPSTSLPATPPPPSGFARRA